MKVISLIHKAKSEGHLLIAQLIDPDHVRNFDHLADIIKIAGEAGVSFFLFGGSLITKAQDFDMLQAIKKITEIPIVLFPSSPSHIDNNADAILFLSLLSGRNAEFLIGQHVAAAPLLKNSSLEIIPTGYILVACGQATTAEYISNTMPIPYNKPEIAAATALAGEMLGMKLIYLDAGSGADRTVSPQMVDKVRQWTNTPLIVGGGIRTLDNAQALEAAGADVLVIGNAAQERPEFITELKASGADMDIVVISSPQTSAAEVPEVIKMFKLGLQHFHIRKPKASKKELGDYIKLYPEEYRKKIVLHSYHALADALKLGGIHLSRHHRNRGKLYHLKLWLKRKMQREMIVTRTFHKLTDVTNDRQKYSYAFLSPVFDSVSQSSLSAGFSRRALLIVIPQAKQPIYALGGITFDKLQMVSENGFHGAVFHGSLWEGKRKPSEMFAEAQTTAKKIDEDRSES